MTNHYKKRRSRKKLLFSMLLICIALISLALTLLTPDNVDALLVLTAQTALIILGKGI